MGEPAKVMTVIRDFPGMATDIDPHDVAEGIAEDQVNAQSQRPGVLEVRSGYLKVTFEAE